MKLILYVLDITQADIAAAADITAPAVTVGLRKKTGAGYLVAQKLINAAKLDAAARRAVEIARDELNEFLDS